MRCSVAHSIAVALLAGIACWGGVFPPSSARTVLASLSARSSWRTAQ